MQNNNQADRMVFNIVLLGVLTLVLGLLSGCDVTETYAIFYTPTVEPTATRTPWPTFTPTATINYDDLIPSATPTFTPVPTEEPKPTDTPVPQPTDTPAPSNPKLRVSGTRTLNVRNGPGTSYGKIGSVREGQEGEVLGRNNDNSWVYMQYDGGQGWIFAQFAQIDGDLNGVEVRQVGSPPPQQQAAAPPPSNPEPAPAPAPAPEQPKFQYTIANVFGQVNEAITQIRGQVKDANGNKVNGVHVRVRSGSFCTVSYASGPPGEYPNGNYDILLDNRAKPGNWQVAVVEGLTHGKDNNCNNVSRVVSEEVTVPTDNREGVVFIEWRKNW
ncbi:MAG: SH3 domain-containing protein [Chloroflexota bacterium]